METEGTALTGRPRKTWWDYGNKVKDTAFWPVPLGCSE